MVMVVVMATARSQKAAPISPIRCRRWRRSCVKPRETLLLKTIGKFRGAGLKPVARASRLILAAKFLRRDAKTLQERAHKLPRQRPKCVSADHGLPSLPPLQITPPHGAVKAAQ